jgi:hypothetical protein
MPPAKYSAGVKEGRNQPVELLAGFVRSDGDFFAVWVKPSIFANVYQVAPRIPAPNPLARNALAEERRKHKASLKTSQNQVLPAKQWNKVSSRSIKSY